MADQEGGPVAHLSPPLPRLERLADLVADAESGGTAASKELEAAVVAYGRSQGDQLAALGIDLNLAPVVDLRTDVVVKMDMYSQIARRAISGDPLLVASVADWYCRGLAESGIACTLKHYPGLGRLTTDSHFFLGDLPSSREMLLASDWIPFAAIAKQGASRTAVMVSHVRLPELDKDRPASLSRAIVQGTLRGDLGFNGLVVTDDLSMFPVYGRRGGVAKAACEALSAGVDLLLISYDVDLYYQAMAGMLDGCGEESLGQVLAVSDARLRRWRGPQTVPGGT
jgi:beta-N-acetylhexosaminidase